MKVNYFGWLIGLIVFICLFFPTYESIGINSTEIKPNLTFKNLQTKIEQPISKEGFDTIDLSDFVIDLTPENLEFREQFYQQLQTKFSRTNTPLALDLSKSVIKGEFLIGRLGITIPLTQGALTSLLTPLEQKRVEEYREIFPQPGEQIPSLNLWRGVLKLNQTEFESRADFTNTLFLQKIAANEAKFTKTSDWSNSYFGREVDFNDAVFEQNTFFAHSYFWYSAKFKRSQFLGVIDFSKSQFKIALSFQSTDFRQLADFSKIDCQEVADFSQTRWRDRATFSRSRFRQSVVFTNATFEQGLIFRDARFNSSINLQSVNLFDQLNFSNAVFTPKAQLNVDGIAFESENAKLIGQTGVISKVIAVDNLENNETVLRNLIRNFRSLEQIPDANQIEYTREKLRLKQLGNQIIGTPWQRILSLSWWCKIGQWLGLSLLLLLGDYGTNFSLVLGAGIIAIAYFSLLFWFLDRYRQRLSKPIIPSRYETVCMSSSYTLFTLVGIVDIWQTTDRPWLTLTCLGFVLLPIPIFSLIRLYYKGRYHKLLNVTYFVEDGSMRQFRLMLGRLPIMPRFPFFRDRYYPILWERRWNWLNYYDFSLNNLIKFGFNDIRLRDEHLPGIVSVLVWYQWSLGVLYIILLLWTLSRTIPGLNLLLYF